jgi:pilus assembly protein CpaB
MGREPPHRMRRSARLLATLRTPGWRRTLLVRRTAALLLAALALALALRPTDAGSRGPVVVAARDLPSGTALAPADLTLATWPGDLVPVCVLTAPADGTGRVLAGAARAGEPITDVRLAGPDSAGRVTGRPGDAAVPIRLTDPDVARLLEPGSRVDVVTPAPNGDRPVVLAADAAVLTVVAAEADTISPGQGSRGRLVLVALPRADAARVAAAALSEQVAVTLR